VRLLAVYPYVPYPLDRGAYHRAFQWLKALAREHEVDLLALAENGEGEAHRGVFEEFCSSVRVFPFQHPAWPRLFPERLSNPLPTTVAHWTIPSLAAEVKSVLAAQSYDAIHLCDFVLGPYFLSASVPLVADRTRVDLQYQLMEQKRSRPSLKRRVLNWENLLKLWRYERLMARRTTFQVLCGPDDETFFRRYIHRDHALAVIPNGVDLAYFQKESFPDVSRDPAPTLVFCGAMDYAPNVDALRWYFSEIHHRIRQRVPDHRLWIVGKNPTPEVRAFGQIEGVHVTGAVEDVRPYYRRAWLQIVPLRIGGGTRLKIVESMAMETPVVSTRIGAQGLPVRHAHDLLLADSAEDFAEQTAGALQDASQRQRLAEFGRATVSARLSWETLGEELRAAYREGFLRSGVKNKRRFRKTETGIAVNRVY
jgi:glycosyltransferase involved in cell wall biosynthesis